MSEHETGQVAASAAEIYEEFFVTALFGAWPSQVLELASVTAGSSVLDVACGTGVAARAAVEAVGREGEVVGLDLNEEMLAMAARVCPQVDWQLGSAESLPFDDAQFDHVISQFGLMFFQDRQAAIAEMLRVLKPGGRACVAVWASLDDTPGYAAIARLLNDLFGAEIARSLEAPFCLGDTQGLQDLFEEAGVSGAQINTRSGRARFESIDAWLYTDIRGWTLAEVINDEDYARLQAAAPDYLGEFETPAGQVEFEMPAHLVTFEAS